MLGNVIGIAVFILWIKGSAAVRGHVELPAGFTMTDKLFFNVFLFSFWPVVFLYIKLS
jgi:hypothetical protein